MKIRVIVALLCIPAFLVVLFLLPPLGLCIFLSVICGIAAFELLRATKSASSMLFLVVSMLFAAGFPFFVFYDLFPAQMYALIFAYIFIAFLTWTTRRERIRFKTLAFGVFAAVGIPFLFSSLLHIQAMPNSIYIIILPFAAAWVTDTFAYFCGMLFGKHKLAPVLSPKKTVEGAVGGTFFCVVCIFFYGLILNNYLPVNYPVLAAYGLVCSVVAQFGDIFMSAVKRQYNVKDFSNIMPGHGGVLDRFDSVLFTAPVMLVLLSVYNII